jgi:hypothetical protein
VTRPWTPNPARSAGFLVPSNPSRSRRQQQRHNNNNNGNFVIFADLAYHNPETGELRRLTDGKRSAAYPVVSPNNQQVVYLSWSGDLQENLRQVRLGHASSRAAAELRAVNVNGQNDRLIYKDNTVPWLKPFIWSPDNQEILTLLERANGARQIAIINTRTSSARVLRTIQGLSPVAMAFSPDGQYISYEVPTARGSGELEFFYFPIDASAQNPLAERRYAVSPFPPAHANNPPPAASFRSASRRHRKREKMGIDKYQRQPTRAHSGSGCRREVEEFPVAEDDAFHSCSKQEARQLRGLRRRATLFKPRWPTGRRRQTRLVAAAAGCQRAAGNVQERPAR